jgi:serine/threonine protein kinase
VTSNPSTSSSQITVGFSPLPSSPLSAGEVALLADFGLATDVSTMNEKMSLTAEVGTPYYTSPEMINNEPCDMAIDCWALGESSPSQISLSN